MNKPKRLSWMNSKAASAAGVMLLACLWIDAAERIVPQLPPPGERLRVVLDTDAACEIDDLGDIAALADPTLAKWEIVSAPNVNWDMLYQPGQGRGQIVRVHEIDRDGTFELLYRRMAAAYPP